MPMIQESKFKRKNEHLTRDMISCPLNKQERIRFEEDKKILQQEKDATALKQLAEIGSIVIHDKKTRQIISVIMNNQRRNKRLGIPDFD